MKDGAPTSRLFGPNMAAHRLLQDQADAPGGQQRLERPAIEPADHRALDQDADAPATRKASGMAMASE